MANENQFRDATKKIRLIDANALSESIKNGSGTPLQKFFADVCVATAPTVDAFPVVHGRWEFADPVSPTLWCSVCKNLAPLDDCADYHSVRTNYCPNCGAKMDVGV